MEIEMHARSRIALLSLCTLAILPAASARAQALVDTTASAAVTTAPATAMPVGPSMQALTAGVQMHVDPATAAPAPRNGQGVGQAGALMIVGGAAFLVGAIIGGDPGTIVMIGGAAVGLYGLYKYLQ